MTLGILFGMVAGALWGFSFIIPFVLDGTPSELIATGRFGVYALISSILLLPNIKKIPHLLRGERLFWWFILSITGNSLYYILMVDAVRITGVPVTSVIVGAIPVTIAIFGASSIAEIKKYSAPLFLIIIGILIIQWPLLEEIYRGETEVSLKGTTLAILAHISWLFFAIMNAKFLKKHNDITPKIWSELLGIGSFVSLLFYIIYRFLTGNSDLYLSGITVKFIILSFVLGCLGSVLGNWFWNEASKRLSTAFVGQLIVFETIFAIIYESIYMNKFPKGFEILSLCILICGVVWASNKATANKNKY